MYSLRIDSQIRGSPSKQVFLGGNKVKREIRLKGRDSTAEFQAEGTLSCISTHLAVKCVDYSIISFKYRQKCFSKIII